MTDQSTVDHRAVIADLEKQLAATSRATRPHEHAVLAYRLGLAYAESPAGNPAEGLRRALAYYDVAAAIFDPRFEPVHHARVLNAAGAAHRGLGDRRKAAELFAKAASLFAEGSNDNERAAAFNNLGLCQTEMGQAEAGIEAFNSALELFDTYTEDGKRGVISALHNRGQAHTHLRTEKHLEAALADFEQARSMIDAEENPLHYGMVEQSVGVTCSELAGVNAEGRSAFLKEAVRAFNNSLKAFTRTGFPYYYALVKHNLGLAQESLGGTANLRRALASFEDALAVFDTRLHAEAWRQAYTSLERVEKELNATESKTRTEHFAALLAVADLEERTALTRERMFRLLALPEPRRTSAVAELARATGLLEFESGRRVYEAILKLVIELPQESQRVSLRAIIEGHRSIEDEDARYEAERALDQAIGDALGGPQRVAVRDFLEGEGWERP